MTYWFGNREGLLAAMVDRLVELREARVAPITAGIAFTSIVAGPDGPLWFT